MAITVKTDESGLAEIPKVIGEIVQEGRDAMLQAARTTAAAIQERVRADIVSAGKFGAEWTQGFKVTVDEGGDTISVTGTMSAPHWEVFQYGATIVGKPLLFFEPTKAPEGSALFSMTKGGALPKVISKHQVTIPKKFHILEIAEEEANKAGAILDDTLKGG